MPKRKLTRRQHQRIKENQTRKNQLSESTDANKAKLMASDLGPEQKGLVISRFGQQVDVRCLRGTHAGQHYRCHKRAHLDALVAGDRVTWRAAPDYRGVVVAMQERDSVLARPDHSNQLKPIAANVTKMIVVFAPVPHPSQLLIDRYLVASCQFSLEPLLVLNKSDLIDHQQVTHATKLLALYQSLGIACLSTSQHEPDSIEQLDQRLLNETSVFVGQSGVGKSSLINALLAEAVTKTGSLSDNAPLGKHTTSSATLYDLMRGGFLIDSPGIREIGLSHATHGDVMGGFSEISARAAECKFRNCVHQNEPACAVKAAVERGEIDASRFTNFQQLLLETE